MSYKELEHLAKIAILNRQTKKEFIGYRDDKDKHKAESAFRSAWSTLHPASPALIAARKCNWILAQLAQVVYIARKATETLQITQHKVLAYRLELAAHELDSQIRLAYPNKRKKLTHAKTNS